MENNVNNYDSNLELDLKNIVKQVELLRYNLGILKFNNKVSKIEDPMSIRKIRRHIAKLLTYKSTLE